MNRRRRKPWKPSTIHRHRGNKISSKLKINDESDQGEGSPPKKFQAMQPFSGDQESESSIRQPPARPPKRPFIVIKKETINIKKELESQNSSLANIPSSHFRTPKRDKKDWSADFTISEFSSSDESLDDDQSKTPPLSPIIGRPRPVDDGPNSQPSSPIIGGSSRHLDADHLITQFSSPARSVPSTTVVDNPTSPQRHSLNTIAKQISLYNTSIDLHVVIYAIYSTPEVKRILVSDADSVFSLIDMSPSFESPEIEVGKSVILKHLGIGSKVTVTSWTPLFSVIWALGSEQRIYHRLLWTVLTTAEAFESECFNYEPISSKVVSIGDIKNKLIGFEDQRITVSGTVQKISKSDFYILSSSGESLRILTLPSFGHQLADDSIGKEVKLLFLRVYRDLYTMDQFSNIDM